MNAIVEPRLHMGKARYAAHKDKEKCQYMKVLKEVRFDEESGFSMEAQQKKMKK